ncbi:FAD-binding oxidoreductase [Ideonella sp. A 288]|uniref:NAD(P)/FAD-dependent oxidoreductase n=1 Tax=Ideonella sp. A 288 TaxID=1962181 RepID=UPI000B4C148B|nr:FAD-binding oxidoreductase [Ideonella sp. A 288]
MSVPIHDIAIVGAGIAGAALAWHLAPQAGVLLLEREAQPGLHSTGRSAAMFMETYGTPQARALTRASRAFYAHPPAGFAATPLLAPRGVLYVGWQGQQGLLDGMEAELRATGAPVDRVDAAEALRRVPVLRADGLLGAVAEPDAMDIDVHALHQGYLAGLRRQGGVLRCDAELVAARREAGIWTLQLRQGEPLRCRVLVDAAGAWADAVATLAGARALGLQPKRRSAFTFAAPAGVDARHWPTVAAIDEAWYFKPDAGQLLGSPANADPVPAHDVVPEELDIATGIHGIEQHTTLTIRRPQRTWAGLRTFAPDGDLVIGWDGAVEGLFWLAGQGGYGIQSAEGAALLAASLLLGRPLPEALQAQGVRAEAMAPGRLGG